MKCLIIILCIALSSCSGLSVSGSVETPYGTFDYRPTK